MKLDKVNLSKLSVLLFTFSVTVVTLSKAFPVDDKSDTQPLDELGHELQHKRVKLSRRNAERKDDDFDPYRNPILGKSKEWSSFEHTQVLKRSDNILPDPVPNPPLADDLGGLNISNPVSKYHCPINLLYGNNLTVKNYFLMMPRCNMSSNDTLQQIQSGGEEQFETRLMPSAQPTVTAPNDIGSLVFNAGAETLAQSFSSPEPESPTPGLESENTLPQGVSLEVVDLTNMNATTSMEGLSFNLTTGPTASVTKIEDVFIRPLERSTVTEANFMEGINNMTSVIAEMSTVPGGGFNSTIGFSEINGNLLTNGVEALLNLSTNGVNNSNVSDILNANIQTTVQASINLNSEILRTVDKYCETFNISDLNANYTISPVSLGLQAHYNAFHDEKQKLKSKNPGIKKEKRTVLRKMIRNDVNE